MTQVRGSRIRLLLICAAVMEAAFLLIHVARDPAEQVALVLASYLVSGVAFGWLLWRLGNTGEDTSSRGMIVALITGGIVFRLTLLPLTPATSQDVQRYLWEGLVQLEGFEDYLPAEISGGMKKRAAIARAMALDPEILFLDEPSAGLDPITSAELDGAILRLSRGRGLTFVIVTHELPSIYTIADRVIMLDKETKSIIASGSPAELRDHSENEWVRRFFRREADGESAAGALA